MYLLLYLGPVFGMAAVIFAVVGNQEAMEMALIGWLVFTFLGVLVKPRTIPEYILTMGNAVIFVGCIAAALIGLI